MRRRRGLRAAAAAVRLRGLVPAAVAIALVPAIAPAADASGEAGAHPSLSALITDARLPEISGFARSRAHRGLLWAHNDGDDAPRLYAIDGDGDVRGTLQLDGVDNTDWEDLASYAHDGRRYLVVADTGDNGGIRKEIALIRVEEPDALSGEARAPADRMRLRWPDGPRDCEALAIDADENAAYLIAKKRVPAEVWRVPLDFSDEDRVHVPQRVGAIAAIAQPSSDDLERNPVFGRYRAQISGADIAPAGDAFAVLNYRAAHVYRRHDGESWAQALARPPREIAYPWLPQAEAIAFDASGDALWISTEKLPAALLRLPID